MSAAKILWGQILAVLIIIVASVWSATQWTASQLGFQPELGAPWFRLFDHPVYRPYDLFWWWFSFDAYAPQIFDTGGMLHAHPSVQLEFAEFLSMLPPMRARQYSISSSPLWREDHVTLTVSVLDEPSLAGTDRHRGVASSYLAALLPGEEALIAVRPSQARFRPPADPATPMILICAGSGIAPFRGFLQERAEILASGQPVGRSLLYFGTNDPDVDYLYRVELEGWEQQGIVSLRPVFTLKPENGQRFVQDRLWAERSEVKQVFRDGAIVFVCGDGLRMAPAVRQTLIDIYREETGDTEGAAEAWADAMERDHGRYVADVFA